MRINITQQQFENSPKLVAAALKKVFETIDFDAYEISRTEIQYCLTNNIGLDKARLYSLVQTEVQMLENVPAAWPNSTDTDEEGNETPVDWFTYCNYTIVEGGYCILYTGARVDANKNHTLPNNTQLLAWMAKFGGFLTKPEVDNMIVANSAD